MGPGGPVDPREFSISHASESREGWSFECGWSFEFVGRGFRTAGDSRWSVLAQLVTIRRMDITTLVLFILGLVLLVIGAEALVKGASRLAVLVGVSPLVIGLTVVSFGTSAPELAVSVSAAYNNAADIALGNVVGSNICNVLLILGISAAIIPLIVNRQLVRIDVPVMIGAALLMWAMCVDGMVSRLDGVVLFGALVIYLFFLVRMSRREEREGKAAAAELEGIETNPPSGGKAIAINILFITVGLGMLVLGSHWLVAGAVMIATVLGLSELVIGLTVVAVGTSLPEIATSVMAAIRGQRDIAVGNVVGSNIFNILCILGLTGIVAPAGIAVQPAALHLDIPFMVAVCIACLPIFFVGHRIDRWEGFVFLGFYAAYTVYLIMMSNKHEALNVYHSVLFLGIGPLVLLTVLIRAYRAFGSKNNG